MDESLHKTEMLALGSASLMKGFGLIGFDTTPDATSHDLKRVIEHLVNNKKRAMVIIEHELANQSRDILEPVIAEGGGILVVEVPPITNPDELISTVSEKISRRLGGAALSNSHE